MDQSLNSRFCDAEIIPVQMLKRSSFKNVELFNIKPGSNQIEKIKREHLILCRFCNYNITSPKSVIEINGKQNYTFTNPAGNTFNIGCFSSAKGCLNYDEPTMENTWFPGFGWCYAICASCYSHLGWCYESPGSSFYGLILNNLIENI
jgi:hypothetical protein